MPLDGRATTTQGHALQAGPARLHLEGTCGRSDVSSMTPETLAASARWSPHEINYHGPAVAIMRQPGAQGLGTGSVAPPISPQNRALSRGQKGRATASRVMGTRAANRQRSSKAQAQSPSDEAMPSPTLAAKTGRALLLLRTRAQDLSPKRSHPQGSQLLRRPYPGATATRAQRRNDTYATAPSLK